MGIRATDVQGDNNNSMRVRVRVFATRSDNDLISAAAGRLNTLNLVNSTYNNAAYRRTVAEPKKTTSVSKENSRVSIEESGGARVPRLIRQTAEHASRNSARPRMIAAFHPLPDLVPVLQEGEMRVQAVEPVQPVNVDVAHNVGVILRQIADQFDAQHLAERQAQQAADPHWPVPPGNVHVWIVRVIQLVGEMLLPLRLQLL